ncbi:MAG: 16S rRNA (uracil(1498)-N(3))-methyltransferase [Deltaproteobacteria bacterium]
MRRFFVEDFKDRDGTCRITGSEARHMAKVLRMTSGDRLILMDGRGHHYQGCITRVGRQVVEVALEARLPSPPASPVEIVLLQALLKSGPMDTLIQKTSELGADRMVPFAAGRSVVRFDEARQANKMTHWKKIARNAAKQSGRGTPLQVGSLSAFEGLLDRYKTVDALKVILWEEEASRDLKGVLRSMSTTRRYVGMVGPEGGFSKAEVERARSAGFTPVSLGRRVLRAETAAIAMTAIVQYELGDLGIP